MKIFEEQDNLTSYTYPLVKIVVICLLNAIILLIRGYLAQFSNRIIDIVVAIVNFVVAMPSLLCVIISIFELIKTYFNRRSIDYRQANTKQMNIEDIIKLASENDIIEIEVRTDDKIIKLGSSAECEDTGFEFKNKAFFISKREYQTIEEFRKALIEIFPQGSVPVIRID